MVNISLKDTFKLLTSSVPQLKTSELIEKCKELGMEEIPYQNNEDDTTPKFDKGYLFQYKTDNDETCTFEILDRGGEIVKSGIQIIMNKLWFFSNLKEHFEIFNQLSKSYFGDSLPHKLKNVMILNFANKHVLVFLARLDFDNKHVLNFRIGNFKFWKKMQNNEYTSKIKQLQKVAKPSAKERIEEQSSGNTSASTQEKYEAGLEGLEAEKKEKVITEYVKIKNTTTQKTKVVKIKIKPGANSPRIYFISYKCKNCKKEIKYYLTRNPDDKKSLYIKDAQINVDDVKPQSQHDAKAI